MAPRTADRRPLCCMTHDKAGAASLPDKCVFKNRRWFPFLAAPCFPEAPDACVESRLLHPAFSCFLFFSVFLLSFYFLLLHSFPSFSVHSPLFLFFFLFLSLLSASFPSDFCGSNLNSFYLFIFSSFFLSPFNITLFHFPFFVILIHPRPIFLFLFSPSYPSSLSFVPLPLLPSSSFPE